MTKPNSTLIVVVLDRSGSMSSLRDDTIGGYNSFIEDQRKNNLGETKVTLVQFDHEYDLVYNMIGIEDVKPLNSQTYVPRGNTALLDSVGRAVNDVGAKLSGLDESERPSKVVFVIITDGRENCSKEFTRQQIKDMIEHQDSQYKWSFSYIGANQDAFAEAQTYGIKGANALTYTASAVGTRNLFGTLARNVTSVANNVASDLSYTDDDRKLNDPTLSNS